MTSTSTPGAASELLLCPFCAETDIVLSTDRELSVSDALCTRCGATAPATAWNHRAGIPAPVTEGAQREAVAWQCRPRGLVNGHPWHWRECDEQDFREKTYCGSVPDEWEFRELFIAPPPPDRVQPERVEAGYDIQRIRDAGNALRKAARATDECANDVLVPREVFGQFVAALMDHPNAPR